MAAKIKNFFKRKKNEAKFNLGLAGPGHRLGDESSSSKEHHVGSSRQNVARAEPSVEAQQAAAAALSRLQKKPDINPAFNTSLAAIRAQAKRELAAEQAASAADKERQEIKSLELQQDPAHLATQGIFFACPLIGPEILSKEEWQIKIKEFLYEQLEQEPGLTAVLMIHTLNKNKEKVEQCIKTMHRMFENIINNPSEEKYRRVKVESRTFQDKIKDIEGGLELLYAAGFEDREEETSPGLIEKYIVYPEEKLSDLDPLSILCDALDTAEPITLELDRGLQVLLPSEASNRMELPHDFFRITPEEIKKEQQIRAEAAERSMMLRTKAMREKDEMREMKYYKYAIIRVRFPDAILLQGTFNVYEKFEAVHNFVRDSVVEQAGETPRPFTLVTPVGQQFKNTMPEMEQSLLDLRLVPASILVFEWSAPATIEGPEQYLKPEVKALLRTL